MTDIVMAEADPMHLESSTAVLNFDMTRLGEVRRPSKVKCCSNKMPSWEIG